MPPISKISFYLMKLEKEQKHNLETVRRQERIKTCSKQLIKLKMEIELPYNPAMYLWTKKKKQ